MLRSLCHLGPKSCPVSTCGQGCVVLASLRNHYGLSFLSPYDPVTESSGFLHSLRDPPLPPWVPAGLFVLWRLVSLDPEQAHEDIRLGQSSRIWTERFRDWIILADAQMERPWGFRSCRERLCFACDHLAQYKIGVLLRTHPPSFLLRSTA